MRYTREQLRDFIKCPQLGSEDYGEWGALRLEQRLAISNLLDQLDSADAYIRQLEKENKVLIDTSRNMLDVTINHYIPKSVIREKIEKVEREEKIELKGLKGQDRYYVKQEFMYKKNILKEILGEEDENRN